MAVKASIIICTYNRSSSLRDTLESIVEMEFPSEIDWEVLVVDNNSTDDTRKKVEEVIHRHPRVKYLFEGRQGKANALNCGVQNACGEILVFTDDDALVCKEWLRLIVNTFEELSADCVGGRVLPLWLDRRPDWLTDRLLNVLAILDLGKDVYELDWKKDEMLYGVNYAFRKAFFVKNGLFNTDLCARGAGNEDQELFDRLRKVRGKAVYHPDVIVMHKVFPDRMTKSYFRRWHFLVGKDRAKLFTDAKFRILNIESYMIRNFMRCVGKYLGAVISFDGTSRFYWELKVILYLSFFESRLKQIGKKRLPPAQCREVRT